MSSKSKQTYVLIAASIVAIMAMVSTIPTMVRAEGAGCMSSGRNQGDFHSNGQSADQPGTALSSSGGNCDAGSGH
ncbi:MAG TPA: hypothetical protein VFJ05_06950 [Nitrososphaeraceae archaeon]|nr:hypothetical protein [Nitrososphaeraceae archaeon]